MSEVRFQLLWHDFVVRTPSSQVDDVLGYVVQHAHHDLEVEDTIRLDIVETATGFDISCNGEHLARADALLGVVDVVYEQVHTAAFTRASLAGWVRAHAAVVDVGSARIALAGPSGIGKTTLALRLLFDGAQAQGDESVLLRDGTALTVARPFHVKVGVEHAVPEIGPMLRALPTLPVEPPVRGFHPDRVSPWAVTAEPLDHVVLVARGERSTLVPVESTTVMHELVENVFWMHESKSTVVREVAAVLRTARCHRLVVDDVTDASRLLQELGER